MGMRYFQGIENGTAAVVVFCGFWHESVVSDLTRELVSCKDHGVTSKQNSPSVLAHPDIVAQGGLSPNSDHWKSQVSQPDIPDLFWLFFFF